MVKTPQQVQQPQIVDPDHVPETLCDGRFFIHAVGNLATLTFTNERPTTTSLGSGLVHMEGVVRARITMPIGNFTALRDLLNSIIKDGGSQIPPGSSAGSTKH